jgi:hypothetical protein
MRESALLLLESSGFKGWKEKEIGRREKYGEKRKKNNKERKIKKKYD